MVMMPKAQSSDYENCPEGNHLAVCFKVIDLGTQEGFDKKQHKIQITWELSEELMENGKPFSISKRYTLSSHEKSTLRKDLESWRGKRFTDEEIENFNIATLLGKPCMIQVSRKIDGDKTYTNVTSVASVPKSLPTKECTNDMVHFDLANFNQAQFDEFPEKLKATIALSPEYQALVA